jgi:hypothetical protein
MAVWVQDVETKAFGNGSNNEANQTNVDKTVKAPSKAAGFKQGMASLQVIVLISSPEARTRSFLSSTV